MLYNEPLKPPHVAAEDDPPNELMDPKNIGSPGPDVLTESKLDTNEADSKRFNSASGTRVIKAGVEDPKKKKPAKLIMCVLNTKYAVVKHSGKRVFKYRLIKDEDAEWDLCWQDGSVTPEQLGKMKPYQKINHFPGMYGLARKDYLGRNLMRMRKALPDLYKFFPKTWMLPAEWLDFGKQFNGKRTFILKPEASCQGRGIFLTKRVEDIKPEQHYVAQKYLTNPYLIDGLKFDMRVYVLLYGCDPLRIFIYHEGLARLATEEYKKPGQGNISEVCMHLTNYAINKNSRKFVFNTDENVQDYGHKRNLNSVWTYIDKKEGGGKSEKIRAQIEDIIIKTICSVQPSLAHLYRSCVSDDIDNSCCFEVLGFDIILDHKLRPWLLEVNHSPSFTTDTPFDWKIKSELITDTITLLNITEKKKKLYLQRKRKELQKRMFTKGQKDQVDEKAEYRSKKLRIRAKFESAHLGGYKLIYPAAETQEKYKICLEKASEIYLSFMGGGSKKLPEAAEKPPLFTKLPPPVPSAAAIATVSNEAKASAAKNEVKSPIKVEAKPTTKIRTSVAVTKRKIAADRNSQSVQRPATIASGIRKPSDGEIFCKPKKERSVTRETDQGELTKVTEKKVFANFTGSIVKRNDKEMESLSLLRPSELRLLAASCHREEYVNSISYTTFGKVSQDGISRQSYVTGNGTGKKKLTTSVGHFPPESTAQSTQRRQHERYNRPLTAAAYTSKRKTNFHYYAAPTNVTNVTSGSCFNKVLSPSKKE